MAFFTALSLYRPTKPPIVTGCDLAKFVEAFRDLCVSANVASISVQLKFGEAIDRDEHPTWTEEKIEGKTHATLSVLHEIGWDVDSSCESLSRMRDTLIRHPKPIYRAFLSLGAATNDIIEHLSRRNSPENPHDLSLDAWGLELGPYEVCDLGADNSYLVGWMDLGISGYGYLYPWTFRDLIQRAEELPQLIRLRELCRTTWPVAPQLPDSRKKRLRKQMGSLWPYDDLTKPSDWFWGLNESG